MEYEKLKEKKANYEEDPRTDEKRERDEKKFNSLPYYRRHESKIVVVQNFTEQDEVRMKDLKK